MSTTRVSVRELETNNELYFYEGALGYSFRPDGNSINVMTASLRSDIIYLQPGWIVSIEETGDDS